MSKQQGIEGLINRITNSNLWQGKNSKLVKRLILLVFVGILFIISGNLLNSGEQEGFRASRELEAELSKQSSYLSSGEAQQEYLLEEKLAELLSSISGVGEVVVNITLDTGGHYEFVKDTNISQRSILEGLNEGEDRRTEEREEQREVVIIRRSDGSEEAVLKQEIKAQIRGVMVVAQGAESAQIRANLISALRAGLGVPAHKISVLPMQR